METNEDLAALASGFADHARAPATREAYARDFQDFHSWCIEHHLCPLPAEPKTVAWYLADRARHLRVATLRRRLAALVIYHREAAAQLDTRNPVLQETWRGIRRTLGTIRRGKTPLMTADIRGIVNTLPTTLAGHRDRALILLGFAGALRRSELVGLEVGDLQFSADGVTVRLRRGKTDQEGEGLIRAVPRGLHPDSCPVSALSTWLINSGVSEGAVFRAVDRFGRLGRDQLGDRSVALIMKRAVACYGRARGWTEREIRCRIENISGHSLRSGLATSAAAAGASEWQIMRQTGHVTREAVRGYIRIGTLFRDNCATNLGL